MREAKREKVFTCPFRNKLTIDAFSRRPNKFKNIFCMADRKTALLLSLMEFSKERFVSIGVTKAMLSVWNIYLQVPL
jgi:hypothetical protein